MPIQGSSFINQVAPSGQTSELLTEINFTPFQILSVVLFFAATVLFTVSRAAPSPDPQLINDDNFPNLSMGLPVTRAALSFNRNGENVANDNANLRGGPLISAIDVLT